MYRVVGPDYRHLFALPNGTTLCRFSPDAASRATLVPPEGAALMIRNDGTDYAWLRFGSGPVARGLGGVFGIAPGERHVIEVQEIGRLGCPVRFGYLGGPLFLAWGEPIRPTAGETGLNGETLQ